MHLTFYTNTALYVLEHHFSFIAKHTAWHQHYGKKKIFFLISVPNNDVWISSSSILVTAGMFFCVTSSLTLVIAGCCTKTPPCSHPPEERDCDQRYPFSRCSSTGSIHTLTSSANNTGQPSYTHRGGRTPWVMLRCCRVMSRECEGQVPCPDWYIMYCFPICDSLPCIL